LHIFPEEKSEHWIKPDSKLLFHFVDILESKGFYKEDLDLSFYHSINQKKMSTAIKKQNNFCPGVFRYKMLYKSESERYMNKPLCKNRQNLDRWKVWCM